MLMDPENATLVEKWERIVSRILADESAGQQELYDAFERGIRFYLAPRLKTQDVADKVHDTFVAVVAAIRAGHVREAARLPGFVRTIAHRQAAGHIEEAARRHSSSLDSVGQLLPSSDGLNPEQETMRRERLQFTRKILKALPEIDRQIVRRFYFEEQSPVQICEDLRITYTQFRLRKCRAKERISELAREVMRKKPRAEKFLLRKKAVAGHL